MSTALRPRHTDRHVWIALCAAVGAGCFSGSIEPGGEEPTGGASAGPGASDKTLTPEAPGAPLPAQVTFDQHIKPLLQRRCVACHNQTTRHGRLRLDVYEDEQSADAFWGRWRNVHGKIATGTMPPPTAGGRLPDGERDLFDRWIEQGLRKTAIGRAREHGACTEPLAPPRLRPRSNAFLANSLQALLFTETSALPDATANAFTGLRTALLGVPEDHDTLELGGLGLRISRAREGALVGAMENVAAWATANNGQVLAARFPCTAATAMDAAAASRCVGETLATLTTQAWGRLPGDLAAFEALYRDVAGTDGHWEGVKAALLTFLIAPETLLAGPLPAEGAATPASKSLAAAQLLAANLHGSVPTRKLLALAQAPGHPLLTPAGLKAALPDLLTERLPTPRPAAPTAPAGPPLFQQRLQEFAERWLELRTLPTPDVKPGDLGGTKLRTLAQHAADEARALIAQVLITDRGRVGDLFTTQKTFLPAASGLNILYGVPATATGPATLGPERAGLLTRAALALTSEPEPVPVLRGAQIAKKLLCEPYEFPSPEVISLLGGDSMLMRDGAPRKEEDALTTRQLWEQRTSAPECALCHERLNGIGFAMAPQDAIGRLRTSETRAGSQGQILTFPIDPSVPLRFDGVGQQIVTSPASLGQAVGRTRAARLCFEESFAAFARGYHYDRADRCVLERVLGAPDEPEPATPPDFVTDLFNLIGEQVQREVNRK
jgi:hypothetical protein